MTTPPPGLRERKKQATREALREAALRLAVERGPDQVRVEDIAEAAGVSPRTYNNYFASREQAIVSAVTADREARIAAAVTARTTGARLADAVTDAVVEQYTNTGEHEQRALLLITTRTALRDAFLDTTADIEPPLTVVIAERLGDTGAHTARVLAASVAAAVRIALEAWLQPTGNTEAAASFGSGGLVVPSGSLPDQLRAALSPLAPAFDAAERHTQP
ncbi:TetR/AcrR family transcriptional regulator [Streptomyces sp. GMY02]|uniref:TetR/AcrR family transcriptional regulator n=1 Tax=Streptomyces sp. GMY02 TaxID=1333528 RepID=UPI001C2CC35C|nr:TetR/AcrR family transcriptional regulator [Streptomyces sp. GMY02]QXE33886.1 TetR/AcrR family transcriptional regulator [Streptomyces sp. GMY02]